MSQNVGVIVSGVAVGVLGLYVVKQIFFSKRSDEERRAYREDESGGGTRRKHRSHNKSKRR